MGEHTHFLMEEEVKNRLRKICMKRGDFSYFVNLAIRQFLERQEGQLSRSQKEMKEPFVESEMEEEDEIKP